MSGTVVPPPLRGDQVNTNDRKWAKKCHIGCKIHRFTEECNIHKLKFLKLLL